MKERPIIMSGDSVRAILNGTKTMTRRVIKPQPWHSDKSWKWTPRGRIDDIEQLMRMDRVIWDDRYLPLGLAQFCPYGAAGNRLWVRETWRIMSLLYDDPPQFQYKADMSCDEPRHDLYAFWDDGQYERWFLRQNDNLQEDCEQARLVPSLSEDYDYTWEVETCPTRWQSPIYMPHYASRITLGITDVRVERLQEISIADAIAEGYETNLRWPDPIDWFRDLWDGHNAKRGYGWNTDPWDWVVSFQMNP